MRWMFLFALAACPHPRTEPTDPTRPTPPDASPGDVEPTLEIETPTRGTFVDDGTVIVRGRVRDDGIVKVRVNQTQVAVDPDGSFATTLSLPRGLAILETHAIDATGHDVRDVRAVLVGPFATAGGPAAWIGARLGRRGVAAFGKALAVTAKAIDWKRAAQALNPIYDDPGCLGARVDIAEVTVGNIEIALAPKDNAIETIVRVDKVEVKLDVNYQVACFAGSSSMSVRTRARVQTEIAARVGAGQIRTAFRKPDVSLDDFQLEMRVPGPIASVLRKVTRPAVEVALAQLIQTRLAPIVDSQLTMLLARPALPQVLGRDLDLVVAPTAIEITPRGILMTADSTLTVNGSRNARYVATRGTGTLGDGEAVGFASAGAANQLLSGLWAAHAFDRTLPRDKLGPLAMLLDERVATVELAIALPPTIHVDPALELAIGDLLITARDAAGAEVQRFAVSLRTGLAIKPGAKLGTTEPTVYAQLLAQNGSLARPLDAAGIEGIVRGVWSLVAGNIDEALGEIWIPGLAEGVELKSLSGRDGAIVLDLVVK